MNKIEILKKAFDKARINGYDINEMEVHWGHLIDSTNCYSIIFNKKFASALWGKESIKHLQQMVADDDPVDYLSENI